MKHLIIFLISILFFSSCRISNVVYTSDDVYYSSPLIRKATVGNYIDLNDRYLSMKSRGNRWQTFDNDFYYWNIPSNRLNWNPFFFDRFSFYDPLFLNSNLAFTPWYSVPYPYWRNSNLFSFNPYNVVVAKPNIKTYPSNTRTFNNGRYMDVNRTFQSTPRQYNLRTFDNNPKGVATPYNKPATSNSAPIRKFDQ